MANYKRHTYFNLFLALPCLLGAIYFLFQPTFSYLLVFTSSFAYSTLFMNPDMDLANRVRLFSLRGLLTLPFRLYALLFRHRGISHSFFFGSLTRIVWLMGWALLIFYLFRETSPSIDSFFSSYKKDRLFFCYLATGVCLADWCHLLLDQRYFKRWKAPTLLTHSYVILYTLQKV